MHCIYTINPLLYIVKALFNKCSFAVTLSFLFVLYVNGQEIATSSCNFLTRKDVATSTKGAEIPAFDPGSKRLFVVAGPVIEYYTMSAAGKLAVGGELQTGFPLLPATIAIPNSVAVSNGILAASYAIVSTTTNAQLPGRVTLYNPATGAVLRSIEVGYLPDMITFTPDGKKLLSANEGEPNSYNLLTSFDPEGSISIIDLSGGIASATVQTVGFTSFNGQRDALLAAGVRIFGPNATVAQDLEPEYIAISPDGKEAWVTLQENNALAMIDIASASVKNVKPLGLKNHNQPIVTGLETYRFTHLPAIGTTAAGQFVPLGGFSGLTFEGYAPNGNLKFITHTDRGPNGEPTGINRPFLLPNFTPEIVRFELKRSSGQLTITQRLPLKNQTNIPLTGLPNISLSTNANQPYNDEVPVDLQGNAIQNLDPLGADLEGIVVAPDGSYWMVDEYRPAIYHFSPAGILINRFVPAGTAAAAGQPVGTFGAESLPAVLSQRRQNRGFEAIAYQDGKIYAFAQSPLRNPATLSNAILNSMQNIRVIEFDPVTQTTTRQFIYRMDNSATIMATDSRADKIGDAVAIGNGEFLVLERDDDAIDSDPLHQIEKRIYRFSLAGATDISLLPEVINGKTLDQMSVSELQAAGVYPIQKHLHIDLPAIGYNNVEKVEGLTIIDRYTVAVINDNDFTVAGITIDPETGTFTPDPNAEDPILGLIKVRHNGLDASDRDTRINIQHWPVFGMYQPDAIAAYTVNGETFYITANEGDARDWPGFSEEIRVGASNYLLDPVIYPNAAVLKNNSNLGRLNVTTANGNGDYDQIQAFGARSFSIWNAAGEQVYDSGDELEQITAALTPDLFNSDGNAASFDTRSDNKGPEPEGVTIGVINSVPYAFIGLERTGDIIVYNVSDPAKPVFVQYINTPEDRGVEGLLFVTAENSPTGRPLLVTTAENSLTVSVFEVNIPTIQVTENSGIAPNDGIVCEGTSVTLMASGDGPFLWSTGAGSASITVTPQETNQYSVTGACSLTSKQTIIVTPAPSGSIIAIPENSTYTGGVATNLYLGYGPQKLTLSVNLSEAGAPYTFEWRGGQLSNLTSANPVFTATAPGTYTFNVLVTNQVGCSSTFGITIRVTDIVVPGTKGKKAYLCHEGKTLEVSLEALSAHLRNHKGDRLDACDQVPGMYLTQKRSVVPEANEKTEFSVRALNNPARDFFTLEVQGDSQKPVQLQVMDATGRVVINYRNASTKTIRFGSDLASGLYIAEIVQGSHRKTLKLIKH